MAEMTLVIANKNYSSWSLRAWLALRHAGADFDEIVVPLGQPDTKDRIAEHSPSGRVPVLQHGDTLTWESLAICEYAAELFPGARLWPDGAEARAAARAVSNEMHGGFAGLRSHMPMNIRGNLPGRGRGPGVDDDVARIAAIWHSCRSNFGHGGPFLFGHFTIADAMYAPVVTRFRTYGEILPGPSQDYADAVWNMPAMQDWVRAAEIEPWTIAKYEM